MVKEWGQSLNEEYISRMKKFVEEAIVMTNNRNPSW